MVGVKHGCLKNKAVVVGLTPTFPTKTLYWLKSLEVTWKLIKYTTWIVWKV